MSEGAKRWGLLFTLVLIVFMAFQFSIYREYAFESTWIYIRKATGFASVLDQKKQGAICNSLERGRCSVRIFRDLVRKRPNDNEGLSNLAMALAMTNKAKEAMPYFKAYFASGGRGFDVMYWYGQALRSEGRDLEAIPWFYNVLYYNVEDRKAAQDLVSILEKSGRLIEAHSLMAALIEEAREGSTKQFWRLKLAAVPQGNRAPASSVVSAADEAAIEQRLPTLDGRHFYIPIRGPQGALAFISSSEDEVETIFNEQDINALGLQFKKINLNQVIINQLNLGPLRVHNLTVNTCKECKSKLAGRALAELGARIDDRGKVPYLILNKGYEK